MNVNFVDDLATQLRLSSNFLQGLDDQFCYELIAQIYATPGTVHLSEGQS